MRTHRSILLARVLMTASLLLLGCSLSWFLWRTYQEEKTALVREVGFVFANTIRSIEGGLLEKLAIQRSASANPGMPVVPRILVMDSVRVMTFVGNQGPVADTPKNNIEIRMSSTTTVDGQPEAPLGETNVVRPFRRLFEVEHAEALPGEIKGTVSLFIAMSGDSLLRDATSAAVDTARFLARLRTEFEQALAIADLPVQHRVSRLDTVLQHQSPPEVLLSGIYTDLANGDRYSVELSGYRLFLLQKMLPQMLFSLLLFGSVALAFLFVFRTLRAQRQLAELKTEFVQNISHELKTPIATVSVALEALRDFDVLKNPDQAREYLDISQLELQRLSLLVEKVLGIAQMDRPGGLNLCLTEVDLHALTNEILAVLRPRIEQAAARVTVEAQGADFQIQGDRLHLSGVLFNLLDNALKYGGENPEIRITLHAADGKTTLRIQDSGPGIPSEYRERIFEAFFRVPSRQGHLVKGHGLGLSYAATVVAHHGGSLVLDDTAGGAAFTIELDRPAM